MVSFSIPIKAFSVNAYYYKTRSFKTPAASDWETLVCAHLARVTDLNILAEAWRANHGVFIVHFTFVYPMHVFFNQAGNVSAKAFDLSNVEKPLLDMLFRETMKVDDRFVTELTSRKRAGADYAIEISLELKAYADSDLCVAGSTHTNKHGA